MSEVEGTYDAAWGAAVGSRVAATRVHVTVTDAIYRRDMELDELFAPDERDVPPHDSTDDAFEL